MGPFFSSGLGLVQPQDPVGIKVLFFIASEQYMIIARKEGTNRQNEQTIKRNRLANITSMVKTWLEENKANREAVMGKKIRNPARQPFHLVMHVQLF